MTSSGICEYLNAVKYSNAALSSRDGKKRHLIMRSTLL